MVIPLYYNCFSSSSIVYSINFIVLPFLVTTFQLYVFSSIVFAFLATTPQYISIYGISIVLSLFQSCISIVCISIILFLSHLLFLAIVLKPPFHHLVPLYIPKVFILPLFCPSFYHSALSLLFLLCPPTLSYLPSPSSPLPPLNCSTTVSICLS